MSEKRHLHKISAGDRSAFSNLLHEHEAGLMRYAIYFLRDIDLAQDAVQETFLRVWKYREKYYQNGSERAYLLHLLKNVCCDMLKSQSNTNLPVDELAEMPIENAREYGFIGAVESAIQLLPADQREVFTLSHFEELTYTEIAQILRCSKGTVASRKRLAIESLRRHLYGWSDENEL